MRLPRKIAKQKPDAAIPLINIVFLLLLFYIVAGQVTPQTPEQMDLPVSEFLAQGNPPNFGTYITRSGEIFFDRRKISLNDLATKLLQKSKTETKDCLASCRIQIVADHRLEAVELLRILKLLKIQGLSNINLATIKGRRQ